MAKINYLAITADNDDDIRDTEIAVTPEYSSIVRNEIQLTQKQNRLEISPPQIRAPKISNQIGDVIDGHRKRSSSPKSPPPPPPATVSKPKITSISKTEYSEATSINAQPHVEATAVTASNKRRSGKT